ncbi:unnamed protein product [Adineta ricciae]|uniref:G-protein coupled receptors family 1 profile domain-containing protein n=1 Tax=Adineta ricciae TaxID=249248 RepID=A0A815EUJ4_ADIRI|nr:unnamed protein product [Adineta ricciae]
MSSFNSDLTDKLNGILVILYKYIVPIIYTLGNIGNIISLIIFLKKSWRKHVCVVYFIMYIFFNTCYLNSTTLASIFIFGYQIMAQTTNIVLCKVYIYMAFIFATISPTILILASIDRLLISSENIQLRLYSSKRLAYFSTGISTAFWMIFNLHVLIKVDIQKVSPTLTICYYDLSKFYFDFVFFSLMAIHIIFGLMMFILCILSFQNVRRIRNISRQQRRNQIRTMKKKDFQLLHCLFVQNLVFITFAFLVNSNFVYGTILRESSPTSLPYIIQQFLDQFLSVLYNIPYCTNFYIFIFMSKSFRQDVYRLVLKLFRKESMVSGDDENNEHHIAVAN